MLRAPGVGWVRCEWTPSRVFPTCRAALRASGPHPGASHKHQPRPRGGSWSASRRWRGRSSRRVTARSRSPTRSTSCRRHCSTSRGSRKSATTEGTHDSACMAKRPRRTAKCRFEKHRTRKLRIPSTPMIPAEGWLAYLFQTPVARLAATGRHAPSQSPSRLDAARGSPLHASAPAANGSSSGVGLRWRSYEPSRARAAAASRAAVVPASWVLIVS